MSNMTDYQVYQDQVNDLLASAHTELGIVDMPPLMYYEVTVTLPDGTWGLGHAVTHLALEDWATLHKYAVINIGLVRRALPNEKTDII